MKSLTIAFAVVAMFAASSCDNHKSYAELLTEENHAVNYFLADHKVVNSIPEDSVFEVGPDAPYYRIDEDSNLYMQVLNPGNPDEKVEIDQLVYFRFTRYNLKYFMATGQLRGEGNADDLTMGSTSFRFQNKELTSTSSYGLGVQEPLKFLGLGCEVNLVIKSQLGPTSEIASVIPFLYNIRYFRSPL